MRTPPLQLRQKITTRLAITTLFLTIFTLQPSSAHAALAQDGTSICQVTITSSTGVTIDTASVPVALTGIYCVLSFKTVGTYAITIPNTTTSVDYLVVGGGGGGGSGGGGAGGVKQGSNYSVTAGSSYTVVVGAGGNGGQGGNGSNGTNATNGGNSSFSAISVLGGGSGGQGNQAAGDGGSGGGARFDCTTVSSACRGVGAVGQGNNGASSTYPSYGGGGGGGGAGSAGGNTTLSHIGGAGGNGVISSITGSDIYYGGGGGGSINENTNTYCGLHAPGTSNSNYYCNGSNPTLEIRGGGIGGLGGGGNGSSYGFSGGTRGQYANATAGTPNTGGGGGGTDPEDNNGAAGGSGIVILRWVAPNSLKTVTFNSNYGTPETSTQNVISGVATQLNAGTFSRPGYIFSGWTVNADGTGTSYGDSTNITTSSNVTLYAKWITGVNKTITFNGNSSTSGTMSAQSAGTSTTISLNQFARTNFIFTGWNTVANGSGYSYSDGAVYAFTSDATLYAQWQAVRPSYTVTFYANGGDGSTPTQTADTPTALTLNGFTRVGYNFLGWDTNYAATTATYIDGQNYAFGANLALYAIWKVQAPNVVTFNGNGNTGGATSSQTASQNTLLNSNGFSRDGYTFLKWNTLANGTGTNYNASYTYSFAAPITLYAVWSQNLTISYSGNGATSGDTPTSQSYYVGGPTLTVSNNAGSLARTGYTLVGWNTAPLGTGTAYAIGGSNARFRADTTLYAQWLGASYSILYTGNENTSGSAPSSQSYTFGDPGITLRANTSSLARTGYTFTGWNTQPNGLGTSYVESATAVTFAADTVLFAQWVGNTYTVTYDANTGTVSAPSATFNYGGSTTLLTPTKTGYTFLGWYDTTTAGTKIADGGTSYSAALSRTLYAHWLINSYSYNYDGNGGTVDTSTVTYTYGDPAIALRTPSRTSYQFNGWYSANSGGIRLGGAGESVTPTSNQSLFAQWTQLSLIGLGGATLINSNTTTAGVGTSFSANSGGTSVTVTYIADALPVGTVIDAYLLPNTTRAAGLIPDASNLLLSLVVAWKATDGTVPTTAVGSPISVVITNAGIRAGAKIYCLIGDTVTLLGTATVDGSASVSFTDDPEIVIANPPVVAPPSGGGSVSTAQTPVVVLPPVVEKEPAVVSAPKENPIVSAPLVATPIAPATPIASGSALVEIQSASGVVTSTVQIVSISPTVPNTQVLTVGEIEMTLSAQNASGASNKILDSIITFSQGDKIVFSVKGFKPNSEVLVYIFSTPILLGKVMTDNQGRYSSSFPSPLELAVGDHTVQLVGFINDGGLANLSLPVRVTQPTKEITIKVYFAMGSDRITTTASKTLTSSISKINRSKVVKIAINGFAQKTYTQINDKVLPQLRAKSVAIFLKKMGYSVKPLITSGGYANERDATARRVEITFTVAR
ncbi:Listeria/Bacterioides repeat [Candidatus Nanopelagicaceae bacterium]